MGWQPTSFPLVLCSAVSRFSSSNRVSHIIFVLENILREIREFRSYRGSPLETLLFGFRDPATGGSRDNVTLRSRPIRQMIPIFGFSTIRISSAWMPRMAFCV